MRKKLSLVTAGLLAGATMSVTAASPAQAQTCESTGDPVLAYVCSIVNNAPDAKELLSHYGDLVFDTVHYAYCTVSPNC